jgi:hypothetical protein
MTLHQQGRYLLVSFWSEKSWIWKLYDASDITADLYVRQ